MPRRKKQEEELFDPHLLTEPKTPEEAEIEAGVIEDASKFNDMNAVADRELGHAALEQELHREEVEAAGNFYESADAIAEGREPESAEKHEEVEQKLFGDPPNTYNEAEAKEIERLRSQGLSLPRAYTQATGKKYQYPPKKSRRHRRPRGREIDPRYLSPDEKMKRDEAPAHIRKQTGRN
jgi:hypothetical protein